MNDAMDLETLERESLRTTWEDGLLDLCAGVSLLGIGTLWVAGSAGLGGIVPGLAIPVWMVARRSISEPRGGYFRPREARRMRTRRGLASVLALGVVLLGAGLLAYGQQRGASGGVVEAARLVRGLPAVLLALPAGIAGAVFGMPRMQAYAALLLVAGTACVWREWHPGWAMLLAGAVVTTTGAMLLRRFLRRHPVPPERA